MTEEKKEDKVYDKNNNRDVLRAGLRGVGYGASSAIALLIALKVNFGPEIGRWLDSTQKDATITQLSNELKRTNQLFEVQQKTLEGLQADQEFSRKIAAHQREELTEKLDLVISENKIEKAERLKIKKELEITSSNTNQLTIDLRRCREDCRRK